MTKIELYNNAKKAYYDGEPIMSDADFDALEQEIGVGNVGAELSGDKVKHPTRMLSLSKFQADKTTGAAPSDEAINWMKGTGCKTFSVTCKYDGNSGNCVYEDGNLKIVISRGNGIEGRDITDKIKNKLPKTIKMKGICEVRGEIIMTKAVFAEKYEGKFANPRNLVAGILGRDDNAMIEDLEFVAYDAKVGGEYLELSEINALGFNSRHAVYEKTFTIGESFNELFNEMIDVRAQSEFPLDGFVLKTPAIKRSVLGENNHDPEWGKAIKFKPVGVTTTIKGVDWFIGKTGEFTPVAILDPVDLDGSTVSKASLYNAGYIEKNDIQIGTRVRIVKSGDIIPQIVEIFK